MRFRERGFSKFELCLVVALLGGLAGVTLPRYHFSEQDQRVHELGARLEVVRGAIDSYREDHEGRLPGLRNGKAGEAIFVSQLTERTDVEGSSSVRGAFGPYLRTWFPKNPVNALNSVKVVEEGAMPKADGGTGWLYHLPTGAFRANEPGRTGTEDVVLYEL